MGEQRAEQGLFVQTSRVGGRGDLQDAHVAVAESETQDKRVVLLQNGDRRGFFVASLGDEDSQLREIGHARR